MSTRYRAIISHRTLADALQALQANPWATVAARAGSSRSLGVHELLVRPSPLGAGVGGDAPADELDVVFGYAPMPADRAGLARRLAAAAPRGRGCLLVAIGGVEGRASLELWLDWPGEPLAQVTEARVVGAGADALTLLGAAPPPIEAAGERWSRLAGALGPQVWASLRQLDIALVGCGRTGSLMAMSLARMGVGALSLIDPDEVELHNLDAMDGVGEEAVGRPKSLALAGAIHPLCPATQLTACVASITALPALDLIKRSHLIVSCVDDDGARWAAGALGALYLRPVLDIGTGVLRGERGLEAGLDVRLALPGGACLYCSGGFARPEQVAALRASAAAEAGARRGRVWRQERAGSLRSLNQIAVGLGARLLEEMLGGEIADSRWVQLRFEAPGQPVVEARPTAPGPGCPLCAVAGAGDAGLAEVSRLPWHTRPLASTPRPG